MEEAARAIEAEFGVAMGSEARVAAACAALRTRSGGWRDPAAAATLERLAPLVAGQTRSLVWPLFELLDEAARRLPRPWAVLEPMLRAGPSELARRALDSVARAASEDRLRFGDAVVGSIARVSETAGSALGQRSSLEQIAQLLGASVADRYLRSKDGPTRRLAARILDLAGRPPERQLGVAVLGEAAYGFLAPYLDFTRATHLDLLSLAAPEHGEIRALRSLRSAEDACGAAILREAVAAFGWPALNLGLEVRTLTGVAIGGGIPLLLSPDEAAFLEGCPHAVRVFDRTLFVAHGARFDGEEVSGDVDARVDRFRAANLAHATALSEFLDLAPLTPERVDRLVAVVGRLVEDFVALFPGERDECAGIRNAYERIRGRIREAFARRGSPGVPAEVTRLVQPFEDPASPMAVGTLHGLKRYLHQRGLRLGIRLVQSGRHATRTVALAIASGDRLTALARPVEYADFDPDPESRGGEIPYPVRVVVEAFALQLLHGQERLPGVRSFCYGNEVHYFVSFRNHPAFIRIDYSPPFAGGMIDLEYYGVSKYELSHHPDTALEGLRAVFRRLEYDVSIENTRVHARYDKERARDAADLCGRAEALFRLAPYLMDLDWTLGHLDLPREGRRLATEAWADIFVRWGVLPLTEILSGDRRAILLRDAPHPAGPVERRWPGSSPYADRLTPDAEAEAAAEEWIRERARARGVEIPVAFGPRDVAQIPLDLAVLLRLRESRAGAARDHPARRFAALVAEGEAPLVEAARVARVVTPLDRLLQFETIGHVSGRPVQHATLAMPGRRLHVALLRDDAGLPGLATVEDTAVAGPAIDAAAVAALLRAHHFPIGDPIGPREQDASTIARAFARAGRDRGLRPLEGERRIPGVRAAPGVASGLARFGTSHRTPADVDRAVLVTDRLSPDDSPFLSRASAVVCTGGGVLSHAGLLAAEFGIPALVIEGAWSAPVDAGATLQFWSAEYEEREHVVGPCTVVERHNLARRDEVLRDGDLIEVSAEDGVVRVLGQDRETLALHDGLRQLEASEVWLVTAVEPEHVLAARGRRAHAVHQLERLLTRVERPDLAAFAVRRLLSGVSAGACPDLLSTLLAGRAGATARGTVEDRVDTLAAGSDASERIAASRIPEATDPFEVVALWLAAAREADRLAVARTVLRATGLAASAAAQGFARATFRDPGGSLGAAAASRLGALADAMLVELGSGSDGPGRPRDRHLVDAILRLDAAGGGPFRDDPRVARARERVARREDERLASLRDRVVLAAEDGGIELLPLIGAKAAGLAEAARLDAAAAVPDWFAITDIAFQQAMALPAADYGGAPVRAAVSRILSTPGLDDRQRSRAIAAIWERLALPPGLEEAVRAAYRGLSRSEACADAPRDSRGDLLVAVRSSTLEEDRPEAMRAGEFDTFLFVAGEEPLLAHVKKAWSGFWTARAIHGRTAAGIGPQPPGGAILVQRIVDPLCAGVLQTINVADGRPWEMAIDVAFGLGEGIVSGQIPADHVTVMKDGGAGLSGSPAEPDGFAPPRQLRFRYTVADKRERVVFDARRGSGTTRAAALYHQGLRPALEYPELEALVTTAERLERAWCQALDIEFAIDSTRLWLLQARPVPVFHATWREIARLHPFAAKEVCHDSLR